MKSAITLKCKGSLLSDHGRVTDVSMRVCMCVFVVVLDHGCTPDDRRLGIYTATSVLGMSLHGSFLSIRPCMTVSADGSES